MSTNSLIKFGVAYANQIAMRSLDKRRDYENMAVSDLKSLDLYKRSKINYFGFDVTSQALNVFDSQYSSCLRFLDWVAEVVSHPGLQAARSNRSKQRNIPN
ncbi:MAG: hypothetical protein WCX73_02685 [Candidatus Pacearchaeota archaeon]|jgi:hypothetical protein